MKKILPIIIAVVITAVASSGITYYVTVEMLDKPSDKNESSYSEDVNGGSSNSGYALEVIDESVVGSSSQNKFEIKSVVVDKDDDGKDVALITIKYSRLSGDAESLYNEVTHACSKIAYQNGVSLEMSYSDSLTKKYNINSSRSDKVMPGYSSEFILKFELKDKASDLVVQLHEDVYGSNYSVSKTFKMK